MADQKPFPSQKEDSSRPSDRDSSTGIYPLSTQATPYDDRSSAPALGPSRTHSATVQGATGGGNPHNRTPSPVRKQDSHAEAANYPVEESQPKGTSLCVYPFQNAEVSPNPKGRSKCTTNCKVLWAILCPVLLGVVTLLGIIGVGITYLPKEYEWVTNSQLADLIPNDTILLYQGKASSITISEVLPASQKPDVSLFVTECIDLIEHTKDQSLTDRPFNFTISSPVPILYYRPLHFELGSNLSFTIATVDASEESILDLLMFDNETKATKYSQNPNPETEAQAIRHWKIDTKERDNSTHIMFTPSYSSYFIPVFSPVPSPILDIELSYIIKQVFYFHGNYMQYTNCSLDVEPCSLHFPAENESCVLAYIPLSSERVTLQTEVKIRKEEHASYDHSLTRHVIGPITGVLALIFIIAILIIIIIACRYMCKRNKVPYNPLQTRP